jgi:drug/metabolite transporter (DMT)-like permease
MNINSLDNPHSRNVTRLAVAFAVFVAAAIYVFGFDTLAKWIGVAVALAAAALAVIYTVVNVRRKG